MKVAILSESAADDTAIRILTDAALGVTTEDIPAHPRPRTRGWPAVLHVLPAVLRHLYYQTDALGLVVVADADDSAMHSTAHDAPVEPRGDCRVCAIRDCITATWVNVKSVPGRGELRAAVGIAYPCIEAWYQCGRGAHVTEAAWARELAAQPGLRQKRVKLKQAAYGTDLPSLESELRVAREEATRLGRDVGTLERLFPNGFGVLADELRRWKV